VDLTFKQARDAIDARLASAETAAQGIDAAITMDFSRRNKPRFEPTGGLNFMRGFSELVSTTRFGVGGGFDRHLKNIFVEILIRVENGDDLVYEIFQVIKTSFVGNSGDGLSFEDPQFLQIPGDDGHRFFVGLGTFPCHWFETRLAI
jgi:hypothetical protein